MRKSIFVCVIAFVAFILSACNEEEMEATDVVKKIIEHSEDVESYHSITEFDIKLELQDDILNERSYMNMDVEIDEAANTIHAQILEKNKQGEHKQDLYRAVDGMGYQKENDEWIKFDAGNASVVDGFTSSYDKITTLVDEIADELEVEEKDGYYMLTFKGASKNVLDALHKPFNVEVNGVEDDDILHDLIISVTKDDFYVEQLVDIITGEEAEGEGTITIDIDQKYSDINILDDIVVPEDIVDHATGL